MHHKKGLIKFHYLVPPFSFLNRTVLKESISFLFKKERFQLNALNYIFCSDSYLLKINKDFLDHDDLTDIITFDLSDRNGVVQAEIYISVERVRENAQIFETSFKEELSRVVFHGALHLCGYKDKTKKAKALMRSKEDQYTGLFNRKVSSVPRGTK